MYREKRNEEVHSIKIATGTAQNIITFTPEPGNIVGVILITGTVANDGFVRCSLKETGNMEVIKPQSIHNLRPRDVKYLDDGKPIQSNGGTLMTFSVFAQDAEGAPVNFADDFLGELILIYAVAADYCNN